MKMNLGLCDHILSLIEKEEQERLLPAEDYLVPMDYLIDYIEDKIVEKAKEEYIEDVWDMLFFFSYFFIHDDKENDRTLADERIVSVILRHLLQLPRIKKA